MATQNAANGTDGGTMIPLAGVDTPDGFAGAAVLVDENGNYISQAHPLPVELSGPIPVTIASALEITNDEGNPIPVEVASLPLPTGASTDLAIAEMKQVLAEFMQEQCVRLADIADSVGNLMTDSSGRIRVTAEVVAAHAVTLSTLANLTNMAQVGGYAANQQIIAQTQMNEFCLRQNIVIS